MQISNNNTQWYLDAKFGIFLHWMATSAVHPGDPVTPGHVFDTPFAQYRSLLSRFTLDGFDSEQFVRRIKKMGARYLVPTSHHADGLCLWDTATSDFKTTNAPAHLDIIDALATACRRHGLKFGFYFPYCDQSHPLIQPLFAINKQDSSRWIDDCPLTPTELKIYRSHLREQIRELCSNYGEIAMLWWDAGPSDIAWANDVKRMVAELQPGVLQNSRWGLDYWHPEKNPDPLPGDFFTAEQIVPSIPVRRNGSRVPFECAETSTGNWVFYRTEKNFYSARALTHDLLESVSKDGNLLLNLSPDEHGCVNKEVDIELTRMSDWMQHHGKAIWDTEAGPRFDIPDVTLTRRGNSLYVHYYGHEPQLCLPDFGALLQSAYQVDGGQQITFTQTTTEMITLDLSNISFNEIATTFCLTFATAPVDTSAPVPIPAAHIITSSSVAGIPTVEQWTRVKHTTVTDANGHNPLMWSITADELSFDVAVCNDTHNLFLRVEVWQRNICHSEQTLLADSFAEAGGFQELQALMRGSSMEIYLDALPCSTEVTADQRCFQLVISPEGKGVLAFAPEDTLVRYSYSVEMTPTGYLVSCTIPFTSLLKDMGRSAVDFNVMNFFSTPRFDIPYSPGAAPVQAGDMIGANFSVNALRMENGVRTNLKLWWQARSKCPFNDPH